MSIRSWIISPSGEFYGSEQVLADYLSCSNKSHVVAIKGKGKLYQKLRGLHNLRCLSFSSVKLLYLRIAIGCSTGKIRSVYLNEAGHIKYILLLASIFRNVEFVVHVRLLEDTSKKRWRSIDRPNLKVLVISKFLKSHLPFQSTLLYDPFNFTEVQTSRQLPETVLHIGIIGRITATKGIDNIVQLLRTIEQSKKSSAFTFHFYGEVSTDMADSTIFKNLIQYNNVFLEGFVDTPKIFATIHCVLHAAVDEPFGRIFLESIHYNVPFIGINKGGIGEIAKSLNLDHVVVDWDELHIGELLFEKLQFVRDNYSHSVEAITAVKDKAREIFNPEFYAKQIDSIVA